MNERIRELMGKTLDSEFSHTWDTMTHEGLLQFSEKFAELIVRDCIDTMYKRGETYAYPSAGFHQAKTFSDAIIEHFGVNNERTN
jgi:hypothetical protein